MKRIPLLALCLFAGPVALAQIYGPPPLTREELRDCIVRSNPMEDRLDHLDREKSILDRETDALARSSARLADDARRLDPSNAAAVADYNARSAEHNRRADAHNRRVAGMNARAARHNDAADTLAADCASRPYLLRDRDVLRERGR